MAEGAFELNLLERQRYIILQNKRSIIIGICLGISALCIIILIGLVIYIGINGRIGGRKHAQTGIATEAGNDNTGNGITTTVKQPDGVSADNVIYLDHKIMKVDYDKYHKDVAPSVPSYTIASDLSNVYDYDRVIGVSVNKDLMSRNGFAVETANYDEFFEIYEDARYCQKPCFVTTDSIMHTYHLYFMMLQKKTEKNYLYRDLGELSSVMLNNSINQYQQVIGTEFEDAARRNVIFFSVANILCGNETNVLSEVKVDVEAELAKINAAAGIDVSTVTGDYEDYSQYIVRGYYEGDDTLEKYFKAMMWYGRLNFTQEKEELNRSSLLMVLAMDDNALAKWEEIYSVTSFFAGSSDDAGYYEYKPMIEEAYGKNATVESIIGDKKGWEAYSYLITQINPPAINSLVFDDDGGKTDKNERGKGFRFMGQRFTLDAAIFNELIYDRVEKGPDNSKRMLPDGLDVPAALGNETAMNILIANGEADRYPNYLEQMTKTREKVAAAPDSLWSSSLYSGWLYTLNPVLEDKGAGYPMFMTNDAWKKKNLETYLGSWTELKHDTILYTKQVMAEMGGGDEEVYDDRGYVEPEPDVYGRLHALIDTTINGLSEYDILDYEDRQNLENLADITDKLQTISVKELSNQGLTNDEYEFIRCYGGNLEHLWYESMRDKMSDGDYIYVSDNPMALIADVATNPDAGTCLEEGIGGASKIYVVFPIDGQLHVGVGGTFTYYQFEQPISNRLTDSEWRQMLGMAPDAYGNYNEKDPSIQNPAWTQDYRYTFDYRSYYGW